MARQRNTAANRKRSSPLALNISRLGQRPGAMLSVSETVASPSRIGLDLVAIEKVAPLHLDLRVESVSEGVLVTGTVSAPTAGDCARCLKPITGNVEIILTELFAYPGSTTEATTEAGEVGRVVDNTVDLEQPVIDAVGLELPLAPLCRPDCPGLCPQCGVGLADFDGTAEPDHHHDIIDPRRANLAGPQTSVGQPGRGRSDESGEPASGGPR
jgi:uncharacterized protein